MDLWYTETEDEVLRSGYKTKKVLFSGQSDFQKIDVIDTYSYGKMMLIDNLVMITDADEFVYHELISHVPVCLHRKPKKVVVIGGGDGGTVRELLKHDCIEEITLCEIDGMVLEAAKEFFPDVACGLDDPRVKVNIGDGIAYMAEHKADDLDLVLVDSTDPIGPGEGLFSRAFYQSVARALKSDGLMCCQSESPWFAEKILNRIRTNVSAGFENIRSYMGAIPTYPRGFWTWTLAAQHNIVPSEYHQDRFNKVKSDLNYLNDDLMTGAFALPNFYLKKFDS